MTAGNSETISEVKGAVLASIPKFILKNFGKDGFDRFLNYVTTEAKTIFSFPVKEKEWYPTKTTLIEPMANIAQLFYDWDLKKAAWELGRFSADFSVTALKKIAFKVGSTVFFLKKAAEFMDGYYRPATIIAPELEKGRAVVHITEFPQIEATIEYRIAGWIERVIEIANNKNVSVRVTKSMARREPYTEIVILWD